MALNALDRHLVLVGFMGAGKTTLGRRARARSSRGRSSTSTARSRRGTGRRSRRSSRAEGSPRSGASRSASPREASPRRAGRRSPSAAARSRSPTTTRCSSGTPSRCSRRRRRHRVGARSRGSDRPLAQDEATFRRLFAERRAIYRAGRRRDVAAATPTASSSRPPASTTSAARSSGSASSCPATGRWRSSRTRTSLGLHGARAQKALGERLVSTHEVPRRRGREAARGRRAALVGADARPRRHASSRSAAAATTDVARLRRRDVSPRHAVGAVPTTLVGQVDAASAARRRSTSPKARTSSARSTGRRAS